MERTSEPDFVYIFPGDGCYSSVGQQVRKNISLRIKIFLSLKNMLSMKKNICRAVCSCCRWGRGACSTAWWCMSCCTRWGSGTSRAGSTGTISTISISIISTISTISIQGPVRHRALGQHPAGDGGSVRQVSGCKHYFKNKI